MSQSGDRLKGRAPLFDKENPAHLEAFYSGYSASFCEHWRKVVLSNCKEIVRARYAVANEKISESRTEDLARLHDNYLDFLVTHLDGREQREENVRQMIGTV